MAKADIKASSKGISTSADRGSGSEPKWERSTRKRLSAERSLRTSPGTRVMVSHLLDPSGKMGRSGEHHAGWIREMGDQKQRLFKGKTPGRELLTARQFFFTIANEAVAPDYYKVSIALRASGLPPM